jgi:adenylate kinase
MVAPPGAGKGTQRTLIATHFNVPHIATGDLLRQHVAHQTDLGRAVQELLTRGELVPDEIVLGMVREAFIAAKEAGTGYVLDGIPRNMEQARAAYRIGLELSMTANVALHLQADDEEVTRRLLARAALEHRADDTEDVIRTRLELYHDVTHPIVAWYAERHPRLGRRHESGRGGRTRDTGRTGGNAVNRRRRARTGPAPDRPHRPERRLRRHVRRRRRDLSASPDGEQGEAQRFDQVEKQPVDYSAREANAGKCEITRDRTLAGTSHCFYSDLRKDQPGAEPAQR